MRENYSNIPSIISITGQPCCYPPIICLLKYIDMYQEHELAAIRVVLGELYQPSTDVCRLLVLSILERTILIVGTSSVFKRNHVRL